YTLPRPTTSLSSFFFRAPAPPALYTLSLHDALPISGRHADLASAAFGPGALRPVPRQCPVRRHIRRPADGRHHRFLFRGLRQLRSEEHTSELQSRENLVCRLLLEKKKGRNYAIFGIE